MIGKTAAEKAQASHEVQNQAAEVALRAKRRAGELLAETVQHQGGRPGENRLTLSQLDVDRLNSQRWQSIARIPEPTFETYIAETQADGGSA